MGLFSFIGGKAKAKPDTTPGTGAVADPPVQTPEPTIEVLLSALAAANADDPSPDPAPSNPSPQSPQSPTTGGKARDVAIYRQLMESLYDALLIVDSSGHVIANNTRAAEFFGQAAPDLWFMDVKILIPSMTLPALTKIRTYVETGRFAITQATCLRKDKTTFSAEIAVRGIKFMNEGDLVFTIRNIERRKVAQRRSNMEAAAVQHAGAAMAICEPSGLLHFQNPAFLKLWGYEDDDQLANVNVRNLFDEPELAEALLSKPQESGSWSGRLSARHKAGHIFTVAASAAAIRTPEGQMESVVLTFIDLSSLRPTAAGALRLRKHETPVEDPALG